MTNHSRIPDFVPTLSPGRHRNPRKGACFMEMASFLAGEKWSDHPACTHRLLAAMAREINDLVGDRARQDLLPLVPAVVGLTGAHPRSDTLIAREAALTALPVVGMSRQRALAVGVLRCEAALADLDGLPDGHLSPRSSFTLAQVPDAEAWARQFITGTASRRDSFVSRGAPAVVHHSVSGIAHACTGDSDQRLVALLRRTIEAMAQLVADDAASEPHAPVSTAGRVNERRPYRLPSAVPGAGHPPTAPVTPAHPGTAPTETALRWDA